LDGVGSKFKNPKPRNWLGGEVVEFVFPFSGQMMRILNVHSQPFPMNPSFLPPIPISDALRTKMYKEYMADPLKNSVRELARKYHLSIKRVDAILRLKGHEMAWIEVGCQIF
jgi:hypothetical protein